MTQIDTERLRELRELLIDQVGHQSVWREKKAEEYPDDARNQESADSLRRLEENLRGLPADHVLWFRLWNVYCGPNAPDDFTDLVTIEHEHLRAYGFSEE